MEDVLGSPLMPKAATTRAAALVSAPISAGEDMLARRGSCGYEISRRASSRGCVSSSSAGRLRPDRRPRQDDGTVGQRFGRRSLGRTSMRCRRGRKRNAMATVEALCALCRCSGDARRADAETMKSRSVMRAGNDARGGIGKDDEWARTGTARGKRRQVSRRPFRTGRGRRRRSRSARNLERADRRGTARRAAGSPASGSARARCREATLGSRWIRSTKIGLRDASSCC